MRTHVGWMAAALLLAAVHLAPPPGALAQDAPPADGPAAAPIPANPPKNPLPPDPPKKVAKEILAALQDFFEKCPAVLSGNANLEAKVARLAAFSKIQKGMQDWNAKLPEGDSCLRNVAWWKDALAASYPTTQPKVKINPADIPFQDAKATPVPVMINVPPGYRGKNTTLYPVILTILEKGSDAKKVIESVYKPLLETHIIAAIQEDKIGADRTRALRALDWVFANFRADHHRVALDGLGQASVLVDALGPEVAVMFNGVVFRAPASASPLIKNLALFPCLAAVPTPAPEPVAAATKAIQENCLEFTQVDDLGKPAADARILDWIAALPPRRIADQGASYAWWAGSERNPQRWGYWFFVNQTVDAGPDLPVMVKVDMDGERNIVDIAAKNLSGCVLLLNDEVLDLDHPVIVRVNGITVLTTEKMDRVLTHLFSNDALFADPKWPRDLFVTAAVSVDVPKEARLTVEERETKARADEEAQNAAKDALKAAEEAAAAKEAEEKAAAEKAAGGNPDPTPEAGGSGTGETPPANLPEESPPPETPLPAAPAWSTDLAAARAAAKEDVRTLVAFIKRPLGGSEEADLFQANLGGALEDPALAPRLALCTLFHHFPGEGEVSGDLKELLGEKAESLKAPILLVLRPDGARFELDVTAGVKPEDQAASFKEFLEKALPPLPAPAAAPPEAPKEPATEEGKGPEEEGKGPEGEDPPPPAPAGDGK